MKKLIIILSVFLSILVSTQVRAVTLKKMAHTSNFILVIAERFGSSQKVSKQTCGLNQNQISEISQKLRIEIDAKIMSLSEKDYKLISERIQNCHIDCSCDIYGLALEKKNIKNTQLDSKSSQITMAEREICLKVNGLNCHSSFFKKLVHQK